MTIILSNTLLRVTAQSLETVVPSPPCAKWNSDWFTHCTHKSKGRKDS